MSCTVVVGAQWGDEGKAKTIDYLSERADIIVRFQGGANAGHTVVVGSDTYVFHLVPSGIIYPGRTCLISNGVVLDAEQLLHEIDELSARGIDMAGRLFVSDRAHLALPYHRAQDLAAERDKGSKKIGTTGRGIGPAYADKSSRRGLRAGDLRDWDRFASRLAKAVERKGELIRAYYGADYALEPEAVVQSYQTVRERLLPMLTDTSQLLFDAIRAGKRVLFEGAQGTFLDIDHGTYPFVTSSNTIAGSVCVGAGIGPSSITNVVGIVKAYTTRVGNGPFPTELLDDAGEHLRRVGGEFGATTGRPRRCGWFDSVLLRKSIELNGMTRMALTKLDVLSEVDEIRICTHYRIDGKCTGRFPSDLHELERAEPVYETLPGWKQPLQAAATLSELPCAAQAYVARLRELCYDVPLLLLSVGADRSRTIEIEPV